MSQPVRVRFAPSPTGFLHVGALRSALFSWLFARQHEGSFILRLEDTDQARLVPESVAQIQDSLQWLGLNWDEGPGKGTHGPYVQSQRLDIYKQQADVLLAEAKLYQDYTSAERLKELREQAQTAKRPFLFRKNMAQLEPKGDEPYVLRFEIPTGGETKWQDAVWGEQSWRNEVIDDFVAIKSDGYPTYQFANVVDDHLMEISHVIRAAEWIPSTPKHILLYEAFGWQKPVFAHVPQVLGPDKAKLSKRHGAKSALDYRDDGYLPEAVVNFLALLGWNPGSGSTQEVFSREELVKAFSFDRVQTSPAVFDPARLDWINGVYIRELSPAELATAAEGFWPSEAKNSKAEYRLKVLGLIQERLKFLAELPELTDFFFSDPKPTADLLTKQLDRTEAAELLRSIIDSLEGSAFSERQLETDLRDLVDKTGVKAGILFTLIRVAITGKTAAPGLFETLHTLGKEISLRRLKAALSALE